jgi:Domain of unknown function (DUF5664)
MKGRKTAQDRKNAPMARGLLGYFPLACAAVSELSRTGNEQHNPGEPMHWARDKSQDHDDCIVRHTTDRLSGEVFDSDGARHRVKVAWRALAAAELELEEALAKEEAALAALDVQTVAVEFEGPADELRAVLDYLEGQGVAAYSALYHYRTRGTATGVGHDANGSPVSLDDVTGEQWNAAQRAYLAGKK